MSSPPLLRNSSSDDAKLRSSPLCASSIALSHPPSTHPHIPQSRVSAALTLLTHTRNPILLARALYLSPSTTPHVLHGGAVAEKLGVELGQKMVDPSYFWTEARWREHRRGLGLPEEPLPDGRIPGEEPGESGQREGAKGTVGAVALDSRGCIGEFSTMLSFPAIVKSYNSSPAPHAYSYPTQPPLPQPEDEQTSFQVESETPLNSAQVTGQENGRKKAPSGASILSSSGDLRRRRWEFRGREMEM